MGNIMTVKEYSNDLYRKARMESALQLKQEKKLKNKKMKTFGQICVCVMVGLVFGYFAYMGF